MKLPERTSSFQLSITAATVLVVGYCLISTVNMGKVEAAQSLLFQQDETPPTLSSAKLPVLVEIFPSEECSKCWAVDAELARLEREQPISDTHIVVLRESVDSLDKDDPNIQYSSELFSRRQQQYRELLRLDSVSTPEIVVNGAIRPKGTSKRQIEGAIAEAVKDPNLVRLEFASVKIGAGPIGFILRDCPSSERYINVIAVLVDRVDTTGAWTTDHGATPLGQAGIVRAFGIVGSSFRTRNVPGRNFLFPFYLAGVDSRTVKAPAALEGKHLVVFAQEKHNEHVGPVIGVASCTLHLPGRQLADNEQTSPADPCPISD